MALVAIIIAVVSLCWTVAWSVYQFRWQNQRQVRVRKGQGWWFVPGEDDRPFITIDVSAVNTGNVPVTLTKAHLRVIGGHSVPIDKWLHEEPTPLGSRAVLGRGEAWVGRLNFKDYDALEKQARGTTPEPWRVVFGVTDAAGNKYELDEADAMPSYRLG